MQQILNRMQRDLELKGYSSKTQTAYKRIVENFCKHFDQPPTELGTEEIKEYLHGLITSGASSSTIDQAYSALKFLYQYTLKRDWDVKGLPRTKKPKRLPVVLSKEEVKEIFESATDLKYKALFMTVYGAGLRISEVANLKITDIDSKNMQIRVRQGKGKKDRYTILSTENLKVLREYWKLYRPEVWLFPGQSGDKPLTARAIERALERTIKRTGITKHATVHTLRHCFATHLLESGVNIYLIQQLMGHSSPSTTSIYIHITSQDLMKVISPLDTMIEV